MGCSLIVIDDWNCEWNCCCMRLVLSEDLGSVNPRHKNLYIYIYDVVDDVDVYDNNDIRWCWCLW